MIEILAAAAGARSKEARIRTLEAQVAVNVAHIETLKAQVAALANAK